MKILLLGADGQLGRALAPHLSSLGELTALTREQLDFTRYEQLKSTIGQYPADVIVNAAAYTAVDKAEQEIEQATAINTTAVATLADIARDRRALLIHYSTDYVFNGEQIAAYQETDIPQPLNIYGQTKLAGERAIQASGCNYLLLRTSWVYSAYGHNFVRRILKLAREREELHIVNDQTGSPTSALHLAQASAQLIQQALAPFQRQICVRELYHLCGAGHTNWYEFACAIVVEAQACGVLLRTPRILPVTSADYLQVAKRPRNSMLNTGKITQQQGILLPHWREGLREVMNTIRDLQMQDV